MPRKITNSSAGVSKKSSAAGTRSFISFSSWKVVLTGHFTLSSRPDLVSALEENGVKVTTSISKATTHLILGSETKQICGTITGIGSTNYWNAIKFDVPIITEDLVWNVLPKTSSKNEDKQETLRLDTRVEPNWRGVRQVAAKLSPSGRANCKGCGEKIAKGLKQVQLKENALVHMLKNGGYEVTRQGIIEETGYPGYAFVTPNTFWSHEACIGLANLNAKRKFEGDWKTICEFINSHQFGDE